jgi:lycopene beta-cyclase
LQTEKTYDYIIAGAGCAGYSLLYHLLKDPELSKKKILVIDANFEKGNDRTWCFWEEGVGPFESIVCNKWTSIEVLKGDMCKQMPTAPFEYKMIQGIDFYQFVTAFAKTFANVDWQSALVQSIQPVGLDLVKIEWEGGAAFGAQVFSSIVTNHSERIVPALWQHFKGIVVEFEQPVFEENIARLMDFNVPQMEATAFMYLLPMSNKKALVEYTLFSPSIIMESAYDRVLNSYMDQHYKGLKFKIVHTEMGAIPMTTKQVASSMKAFVPIGTIGDAVKASTGYAFQFIQAQSSMLVKQLNAQQVIDAAVHNTRHRFYDAVLLYILENKKMAGDEIFARIFKKNKAATIFRFLSNSSTLMEDIQIMRSLPTSIFLPAAIKVMFRR